MRAAFTLIEVLVALVLFAFGMLALAATSAATARSLGTAVRRARAGAAAVERVELLRPLACSAAASGRAALSGLTETWRVDALGRRRMIVDSIEIATPTGRTTTVIRRAWIICAA